MSLLAEIFTRIEPFKYKVDNIGYNIIVCDVKKLTKDDLSIIEQINGCIIGQLIRLPPLEDDDQLQMFMVGQPW